MNYYDIRTYNKHTTNAVVSCVVLHNFCEKLGDVCQPEWIHSTDESENSTPDLEPPSAIATRTGFNATSIRNALKQYVYENQ